jgi:Ni,Fe-hydrogenase III large subunit/Ni,Fe-hydrogenase III component G
MDPTERFTTINGALPARHACVDAASWSATLATLLERDARLLSLWGRDARAERGDFRVYAALQETDCITVLEHPVAPAAPDYPALDSLYPAAERMQRALADLLGVRAEPCSRLAARPWLRHDAWSAQEHPLRRDFAPGEPPAPAQYPFVKVSGEGVHEIPVGPVHAGIIEPGHFRFTVVGEKVLRLEERLGYVHKGIEKRFEQLEPQAATRLAARVSGDSAAAFAWSYAMALEGITGVTVPARGAWLRALLLERERIANHLGDLGALGNDAGFAIGLAQFSRLKEDWLRANAQAFGARYPFDAIVPGGVAVDPDAPARATLLASADRLERELAALRRLYEGHAGMRDRFTDCGRVSPQLANQLGLTGLAGRASAQWFDLRADLTVPPWAELAPVKMRHAGGDVAARVALRFDECAESLRLCRQILRQLPDGPARGTLPAVPAGFGIGAVEGWRGPVLVALHIGADGGIARCHAHDPSWHNWPVLEHAVIGNIVPDFPLINKSFNLSYSGHDL